MSCPKMQGYLQICKEDGLKYAEIAWLLDISIKTEAFQMAIAIRRIKTHSELN